MNVSVRQVEVLGRRIVEPLPLVELGVGSVRTRISDGVGFGEPDAVG
jgi:hypothetical protein